MSNHKMNSQQSLTQQLRELIVLANKSGLYDAADWLQINMLKKEQIVGIDKELNKILNNI